MKNISPAKKIELKGILKALLLNEGLSIKEAAGKLEIHRKTVWTWVNEDGYRAQLKNCKFEGLKIKKDKESVSQFEAKIRVNKPEWYPIVKAAIEYFRKPNLNNI